MTTIGIAVPPRVPSVPGVYFLLGEHRRLLYVGKASNLRQRLSAHARSDRWGQVKDLRYEVLRSGAAALAREADLLAAVRPPWNRTHLDDYFSFVTVTTKDLSLGPEGDYGCFPHLGRGALSQSGRACIDGFDALNRIVRATRPESALVHEFLSGESDRLLQVPLDLDQPHVRHGVERDRSLATGFYQAGPRSLRALRLRHHGKGPVARHQFIDWIAGEVAEMIGP